MRFLGCLLVITCAVFSMEHPAQESNVKKFSCHNYLFGYVFNQMSATIANLEYIHLCDYEQTRACSDEDRCHINNRLFKRLMIELFHINNPRAKESLERLIDRLRTGRITMDQKCTRLSHKDLCHRIFSHINARKDNEDIHLVLNNHLVRPYFQLHDRATCVHQFTTIMYEYACDIEQVLFGGNLDKEFEALRPFPSLVALAAQVIRKNRKREELPILPQELESLLH